MKKLTDAEYEEFGKNENVARMLDKYLDSKQTEYAVLLTGTWGSGKTYFIENFINKKRESIANSNKSASELEPKDERVFCTISLFDARNYSDIDNSIISQANPFLSSKQVKNLGRLLNSAVDKGISLFLPAEIAEVAGKAKDTTLSFFQEIVDKFPTELVIVLDDLERSSIPPREILGYVNSLLIKNNAKVILLADENIFSKNASTHNSSEDEGSNEPIDVNSFKTIKEKVIGKTIKIKSDFNNVYEQYLYNIDKQTIKEYLSRNKANLFKVYRQSQFNNLRVLKYFLFEAEVFLGHAEKVPNKGDYLFDEFINTFIEFLFIRIFLHHTTETNPSELSGTTFSPPIRAKISKQKEKHNRPTNIFISSELAGLLRMYFDGEHVYMEIITNILKRFEFGWKGVRINPYALSKENFKQQTDFIKKQLSEHAYTNPLIILYIFLQRIHFFNEGFLEDAPNYVFEEFKCYINTADTKLKMNSFSDRKSYDMQGVFPIDNAESEKFADYMYNTLKDSYKDEYIDLGYKLVNSISNHSKFYKLISEISNNKTNFNTFYIDAVSFMAELIKASDKDTILFEMAELSKSRYFSSEDEIENTYVWWEKLHTEFQKNSYDNFDKLVIERLFQDININEHKFSWQK